MRFLNFLLIIIVLFILSVPSFTFVVKESETAIKLRFGEVIRPIIPNPEDPNDKGLPDFEPGLHFKWPFMETVKVYDARILNMETPPERFLIKEGKAMIVDYFVKWRIQDVSAFYRTIGGSQVSVGIEVQANNRLSQIVKDGLQVAFSTKSLSEAISSERDVIMKSVQEETNKKTKELGIEVVDVRVKRIDLPEEVSSSVFLRMEKEREVAAQDFRAAGEREARKIRAEAERDRDIILAEAFSEAEKTRGEGDRDAAKIYAEAFGQDEEFYRFYRSLNAYAKVFNNKGNTMVLHPDSEFFRYFRQSVISDITLPSADVASEVKVDEVIEPTVNESETVTSVDQATE